MTQGTSPTPDPPPDKSHRQKQVSGGAGKKVSSPSVKTTAMTRCAGLLSCPVLVSHTIAGEPVLPFALMLDWFAHAATHANPGLVFTGMDGVRVLKGIKPGKQELTVEIQTGKCTPTSDGFRVEGQILSPNGAKAPTLHANGDILLDNLLPAPPVLDRSRLITLPKSHLSMERVYDDILFHGPDLHGIKTVVGCSPMGIEVLAKRAPAPETWLASPPGKKWLLDPLIMDCAFQAAIIWCHETLHMVCLPTYIANLRIYRGIANRDGDVTINLTVNEQSRHTIKGYFTFIDEQGEVIASITGFEAVMDPRLEERFSQGKSISRPASPDRVPRKEKLSSPPSRLAGTAPTVSGTSTTKETTSPPLFQGENSGLCRG